MPDPADDPVVQQYRKEITETDLAILRAVNTRVRLVARLHQHKREHGYDVVDRGREQALIEFLRRENTGPLSSDRLAELYATLLEVCKAEAARIGAARSRAG